MKKLVLCVMTASMLSLFCSTQTKAATDMTPATTTGTTTVNADKSNADVIRLDEIKPIEMNALASSEKKEMLKDVSPVKNDQDEHGSGYDRRNRRNVDVTVREDHGPGYYEGRHRGGGLYIGVGGLLILILILVLVL
jgi:hypothetical protein